MARKPPRPHKPPTSTATSTDEQVRLALVHIEKGRFRDAIECYKALLKTERRADWLAGLASAYAGRAQGLAAKGMRREAIELWRSRAEFCGTPLWEGPYIGWLMDEGRIADVLGHLSALRAKADAAPSDPRNDQIATLETQLAPFVLTVETASLAHLPPESALLQQRPAALAALTAYAQKDAAGLESALTEIPFRSPYRDLRLLLKAWLLWETDPQAARAAIDRLPVDGPFERLAAPLRTLLAAGSEWLRPWASLKGGEQALALELLGCPQAFAPLLRALAAADPELAPAALFDLVQRHAHELPNPLATRVWKWLAPWAKRRGCDSPRLFGSPTAADEECAKALAQEIGGDLNHAETHWSDAADHLATSNEADDRLRAALILRHAALSPEHLSREGTLDQEGAELLAKSLKFDLEDPAVHVRLVQFWRREGNLKKARDRLDAGLVFFPDDVALLTEAVEVAVAGAAFKKAATAARRLLALDPLNRKVRTLVGHAHLSHAIKQIKADKLSAAKKEIGEAAQWLDATADQGRMHLLQAWTEPAGHAERLRLAQLAVGTWGGAGLAAGWRLLREAQGTFARVSLNTSLWLLDEAGIDTKKALTAAEFLELVQVLEQEAPVIHKGQDPLEPWRRAITTLATGPSFDADTTVRICEALSRHEERHLLIKVADAARKRWPDRPIFAYHTVAARFDKKHGIEGERDYDLLENALERASKNKDSKLVRRIEALFDEDESLSDFDDSDLPDFSEMPFGSGKADSTKMLREMIEMTVEMMGEKAFLKQARLNLGDALYQQVEKESAGNHATFMRRIIDLAVAAMKNTIGDLPPFKPPEIVKRKTPF